MIKKLKWMLPVAIVFGGGLGLLRDYFVQLGSPMPLPAPVVFQIPGGAGLSTVAADLKQRGWLPGRVALYLRIHGQLTGESGQLKVGEYELTPDLSPLEALDLFVAGKTLQHPLRIGEAVNFRGLMALVQSAEFLRKTLPADATPEMVMSTLGRLGLHPEGRFFPDTYHLTRNTPDVGFLRQAAEAMDKVLAEEWAGRETDLPYQTPEEALVMASIVEKETGVPDERTMVAGVFVNRLRTGMRLQTDPTVIYGIGSAYDGNIRREDLLKDTPYNTYTRSGLPPTPICMPGRASIHAALHPAPTKALFFVSRGDGTHVFSETLEEHNAAVRRYQLKQPEPVSKAPEASTTKKVSKKSRRGKKQSEKK